MNLESYKTIRSDISRLVEQAQAEPPATDSNRKKDSEKDARIIQLAADKLEKDGKFPLKLLMKEIPKGEADEAEVKVILTSAGLVIKGGIITLP